MVWQCAWLFYTCWRTEKINFCCRHLFFMASPVVSLTYRFISLLGNPKIRNLKSEIMNSRVCLFPGTFDPVTLGHTDIINRALPLFDKIWSSKMVINTPANVVGTVEGTKALFRAGNLRYLEFERTLRR